jgi:hypothetical protein
VSEIIEAKAQGQKVMLGYARVHSYSLQVDISNEWLTLVD